MNTNRNGVTENAFSKVDHDKFGENLESIFGKKESPWCEYCGKRISFCECHLPARGCCCHLSSPCDYCEIKSLLPSDSVSHTLD